MADCQDLINKLEEIKVIYQAENVKLELWQTNVLEHLAQLPGICEQLNQRLVHRDFIAQAALDQASATGLAGDVVAARLAQLIQALTGVLPPNNAVPTTPVTPLALNVDTTFNPPE